MDRKSPNGHMRPVRFRQAGTEAARFAGLLLFWSWLEYLANTGLSDKVLSWSYPSIGLLEMMWEVRLQLDTNVRDCNQPRIVNRNSTPSGPVTDWILDLGNQTVLGRLSDMFGSLVRGHCLYLAIVTLKVLFALAVHPQFASTSIH